MKWNMRLALTAGLMVCFGALARADTILGTFTVMSGLGDPSNAAPTGLTVDWCTPVSFFTCSGSVFDTIGVISPSINPQSFDIFPADDPDFATIASAIKTGSSSCEFEFGSSNFPKGAGVFSPCTFGPASTVNFMRLTVSPFQIVDDRVNSGYWLLVGTSTPGACFGYSCFSLTAEAYGTTAVPEPATIGLLATGLAGLAQRVRRRSKIKR